MGKNDPARGPVLPVGELKLGDVLLFRGESRESVWIERLDGGTFSHAAMFVGEHVCKVDKQPEKVRPALIEAARDGVQYYGVQGRVDSEGLACVYRWHDGDGEELGSSRYPVEPLMETAAGWENAPYNFFQLYLIAVLLVSKRIQVSADKRWILAAACWIADRLYEHGRKMVVCSELVYRCYAETGSGYDIDITRLPMMAAATRDLDLPDLDRDEALRNLGDHLPDEIDRLEQHPELDEKVNTAIRRVAQEGAGVRKVALAVPPMFVTPRSLEQSPSLRLVGHLNRT